MNRTLFLVLGFLFAVTGLGSLGLSASAQLAEPNRGQMNAALNMAEKTKCYDNGSQYPRCYTFKRLHRNTSIVESVPAVNHSHKRIKTHCSFELRITRTVKAGADVSAAVEAKLFSVVSASTSITLHEGVSQTAERATKVGGSFWLKPSERVICNRTYGSVVARVHAHQYYTNRPNFDRTYKVRIPSSLGIQFDD